MVQEMEFHELKCRSRVLLAIAQDYLEFGSEGKYPDFLLANNAERVCNEALICALKVRDDRAAVNIMTLLVRREMYDPKLFEDDRVVSATIGFVRRAFELSSGWARKEVLESAIDLSDSFWVKARPALWQLYVNERQVLVDGFKEPDLLTEFNENFERIESLEPVEFDVLGEHVLVERSLASLDTLLMRRRKMHPTKVHSMSEHEELELLGSFLTQTPTVRLRCRLLENMHWEVLEGHQIFFVLDAVLGDRDGEVYAVDVSRVGVDRCPFVKASVDECREKGYMPLFLIEETLDFLDWIEPMGEGEKKVCNQVLKRFREANVLVDEVCN